MKTSKHISVISGIASIFPDRASAPSVLQEHECLIGSDDAALRQHINRRGIRYKDQATRLALAAATRALALAQWTGGSAPERCAVVAGSCFGNADTVINTARQLVEVGSGALSPMDLPNASANVLASTLAIWFGFRGPNLFFASGRATGADLLGFANNLLMAGRCDHVLVVGAEAEQAALLPWFATEDGMRTDPMSVACALLLESQASAAARGLEVARLNELIFAPEATPGRRRGVPDIAKRILSPDLILRAHSAAHLLGVQAVDSALRQGHAPLVSPWPGLQLRSADATSSAPAKVLEEMY